MNNKINNNKHIIQWLLLPIVIIVISLGWKYPWLGFSVPLVMFIGIIGALFNGRYVCGNLCPRGAFFDRIISYISPNRPIPSFFRSMTLRFTILILLMGLMVYRLSQNLHSLDHWGKVFWLMCTATTILGIALALFYRPRTWCTFCPIGTIGKILAERKIKPYLQLNTTKCTGCKLCEKACPMNLKIISPTKTLLFNSDCIKCGECVTKCKFSALSKNSYPSTIE